MSEVTDIPEGYELYPGDGSFNDACGPMYMKFEEGEPPRFAIKVEKHLLNPMGICHGAVYMALLDMAFPSVIGHAMGKYTGTPTMNININYLKLAKEGEWLFADAVCDKVARTAAFVHASVVNQDGEIKATATGVFKVPSDLKATADISDVPNEK